MLWQTFQATELKSTGPTPGPVVWTILGANPIFSDCVSNAKAVVEHEAEKWKGIGNRINKVPGTQVQVLTRRGQTDEGGILDFQFKCLPDTIDPRGPKTK